MRGIPLGPWLVQFAAVRMLGRQVPDALSDCRCVIAGGRPPGGDCHYKLEALHGQKILDDW